MAEATTHYGLRLTLGGAPNTPHTFDGVPGLYRPNIPTPVGGAGEMSVEHARSLSKSKSVFLELVEISGQEELEQARAQAAADLRASREGVMEARKYADGAEREQVADELKAVVTSKRSK